ncbi:hypothetical protein HNQ78_002346 [Phycisphaera mikurensis]|nr:hypothetical protein [Phycisphaera mikurensis]
MHHPHAAGIIGSVAADRLRTIAALDAVGAGR